MHVKLYNHNTINLTYNASSQSAQKDYTNLLTIGKKYRVSFDFGIDGITTASFTINNGSTQVRNKTTTITTKEITEFTATATNLTLLATLSAGNYGRLAHIDNLEIAEIAEVGESYRFGFNGMEKDNEMKGEGNSYDFGARIYDSRLGRWLSLDPLQQEYPFISPYNFTLNSPITSVDPDGKRVIVTRIPGEGKDGRDLVMIKVDAKWVDKTSRILALETQKKKVGGIQNQESGRYRRSLRTLDKMQTAYNAYAQKEMQEIKSSIESVFNGMDELK